MSTKRLLAVLGSPRPDGACAAMLDCAVSAASRGGWEVEELRLSEQHLAFCRGCRACLRTGRCIQQDDLQKIADLWTHSDVIVVAAPTYWANIPAMLKNLFDRLLGVALEEGVRAPKARRPGQQSCLLLTSCKAPFPFSVLSGQSSGAFRAMEAFFRQSGVRCLGKVAYPAPSGAALPERVKRKIEACLR